MTTDDRPQGQFIHFENDHNSERWRRQLWGTGARAPWTSKCLISGVSLEPHKLRHSDWVHRYGANFTRQKFCVCRYK